MGKAGVYPAGSDTAKISVDSPTMKVVKTSVTYVADFNAKLTVATDVTALADQTGTNGTFTNDSGTANYQLKPAADLDSGSANIAFSGMDSAKITGVHNGETEVTTKTVNVVSASSVYLDDDLLNVTAAMGDGSGYNADLPLVSGTSTLTTIDEGGNASLFNGALFVDDATKLKLSRPVTDENGKYELNDDGTTKTESIYADTFTAYTANSPKYELYLDPGQAIAFQLSSIARGGKLWLGLSAPDSTNTAHTGEITVNGEKVPVTSAMDSYYPITLGSNGVVIVTNTGSTMVSVTNLKITGVAALAQTTTDEADTPQQDRLTSAMFAPVTMRTVMLAANDGADPDETTPAETEMPAEPEVPDGPDIPDTADEPDPSDESNDATDPKPGWTDGANLVRTLFQQLLKTLTGLFGGLSKW